MDIVTRDVYFVKQIRVVQMGFEPTTSPYKGSLHQIEPYRHMVGRIGVEPIMFTLWDQIYSLM